MLPKYASDQGYDVVVSVLDAGAFRDAQTLANIFKGKGLKVAIDRRDIGIKEKLVEYGDTNSPSIFVGNQSLANGTARICVPDLAFGFIDRSMRDSVDMLLSLFDLPQFPLDKTLPGEDTASLTLLREMVAGRPQETA